MIWPLHMDVGSRNARLYEELAKMGLFVFPIFAENDPTRIDYLHVAVSPPEYVTKQSTGGGVAEPMASAKVGNEVGTAGAGGDNVVYLPPICAALSVLISGNDSAIAIDAEKGPA